MVNLGGWLLGWEAEGRAFPTIYEVPPRGNILTVTCENPRPEGLGGGF